MQTTIAILNQKGGVGKTTTAVTIASGLARMGCRVLLIDLDTQGNVADSLGLPHGDDLRRLLSPDLRCPLENVITPSGLKCLDVIRSDKSTTALKQTLAGVTLREYVLADVLQDSGYDVIALDCAPSVDLLHFAALVAADYLWTSCLAAHSAGYPMSGGYPLWENTLGIRTERQSPDRLRTGK
jgi:chromosome partitioning protein